MSNSLLIEWCEKLLFGGSSVSSPPPDEIRDFLLRMEVENVPWSHIILQGGLTAFPYQVHGDLNSLIDYLQGQWLDKRPLIEPSPFKTRAVSRFWDELKLLLARRDAEIPPALPIPSKRDDEILKDLLDKGFSEQYNFESAKFWGDVARRFIHLRTSEEPSPLPKVSNRNLKRVMELYEITSRARGRYFDPLNMYLVHRSEYVNSAYWQTDQNLEAFMRNQPSHPLTLSVQSLLNRTINELLQGDKPTALTNPSPSLDALLHNVRVIHESVQQVPHENAPPKLIDIFQRLLALCHKDNLWEEDVKAIDPIPNLVGTSLLYLTEQLQIAEREKRLLWKHVTEREKEFFPKQQERICLDSSYARDKEFWR